MEKNLNTALETVFSNSSVSGVLCADENGLCLSSKGNVEKSSSGSLVHLMQLASKLEPQKNPVVRLESDSKEVLIKSEGGLTVAIVRTRKQ